MASGGTIYYAERSGLDEAWYVAMRWPRSRHRYGGSCLLHRADGEAQAREIAAELTRRMERPAGV